MRGRWMPPTLAAGLLAACGTVTVEGTVAGITVDDSDAIAGRSAFFGVDTLQVVIGGGTEALCEELSAGTLRRSASLLELSIVTQGLSARSYGVGTADGLVGATVTQLDAACGAATTRRATAGSIRLSQLDGTVVEGSFTLDFDGDRLTGDFGAASCARTERPELKRCR
jgi:hypothetical protein